MNCPCSGQCVPQQLAVNCGCWIGACSSLSAGGATGRLLACRSCPGYRPVISNGASQKHGKSHVPHGRDPSCGAPWTQPMCADTLENSGNGERLEGTARCPPGWSLSEILVHLLFISLGFAELMILEQWCGINWDAGLPSLPQDTSRHHI